MKEGVPSNGQAVGTTFARSLSLIMVATAADPVSLGCWVARSTACKAGGDLMGGAPQDVRYFSAALTFLLLEMGLIIPLGTAIKLQPFGKQSGAASALLVSCKWAAQPSLLALAPRSQWPPT
ncbi:hypothetical protein RD110_22220 [Rhodoferax koreense]|uniref:Uncharacterized protein n=1 Tax=Rhodoferax koreensis TaxID=1842727 RepID=A0A1P8K0Q8_9BURK|nr:hypothetical protein [Rhodoferax koreense]APW39587.1 hypothetical protein RD110_22220 [Rhodoferax koreense]